LVGCDNEVKSASGNNSFHQRRLYLSQNIVRYLHRRSPCPFHLVQCLVREGHWWPPPKTAMSSDASTVGGIDSAAWTSCTSVNSGPPLMRYRPGHGGGGKSILQTLCPLKRRSAIARSTSLITPTLETLGASGRPIRFGVSITTSPLLSAGHNHSQRTRRTSCCVQPSDWSLLYILNQSPDPAFRRSLNSLSISFCFWFNLLSASVSARLAYDAFCFASS